MRGLLVVPAVVASLLTAVLPVRAAAAGQLTLAPTMTAWFDQTYPTATAAPPPAPAGVAAGDLYVAGATVPADALPVTAPGAGVRVVLALSAMRFVVPTGSSPASLTLVLTPGPSTASAGNRLPTGVTLEACPTTSDFRPGGQQPFDQAPGYDCSGRTSFSSLSADGRSVVFPDIARVARGRVLSFVLRPGTTGVDRLVFAPPTSRSLSLLDFDGPLAPAPDGAPPLRGVVGTPLPTPAGPAPVPVTADTPGAVAPVPAPVALSSPVPQEQAPALAVAESAPVDDAADRWAALAGLMVLLAAGAWLSRTERALAPQGQDWGFGRYRGPREGRAPSL
jgi:hypothetical protein